MQLCLWTNVWNRVKVCTSMYIKKKKNKHDSKCGHVESVDLCVYTTEVNW